MSTTESKMMKIEGIKAEYENSLVANHAGKVDAGEHRATGTRCLARLQRMGCGGRMYAWAILVPTNEWATSRAVQNILSK